MLVRLGGPLSKASQSSTGAVPQLHPRTLATFFPPAGPP